MRNLRTTVVGAAVVAGLALIGCQQHDHPNGDHPHDHPAKTTDHPKADHPKTDHPTGEHPK
jgi:hypothetical protein